MILLVKLKIPIRYPNPYDICIQGNTINEYPILTIVGWINIEIINSIDKYKNIGIKKNKSLNP